jgi:hypothetical protein
MHPDLGAAPPDPKHKMSAGMDGRESGYPDVLEDAENRKLALLVDEGVIRQDREIDLQVRIPGPS